jgi:hypothetical protein
MIATSAAIPDEPGSTEPISEETTGLKQPPGEICGFLWRLWYTFWQHRQPSVLLFALTGFHMIFTRSLPKLTQDHGII